MKIAVPTKENNRIDNHFGHCEFYTIFNISEDNRIEEETVLKSPKGCGCKSNVAFDLAQMGVRVMLAGGIGDGAIAKLAQQNIRVIRNCEGDVHQLVEEYLAGNLKDGGNSCAAHGEDHVCNH
jgi:predicted Fe-Mo cluster-binding NifX family protein